MNVCDTDVQKERAWRQQMMHEIDGVKKLGREKREAGENWTIESNKKYIFKKVPLNNMS